MKYAEGMKHLKKNIKDANIEIDALGSKVLTQDAVIASMLDVTRVQELTILTLKVIVCEAAGITTGDFDHMYEMIKSKSEAVASKESDPVQLDLGFGSIGSAAEAIGKAAKKAGDESMGINYPDHYSMH